MENQKRFLTYLWSNLGVVGNGGDDSPAKTGFSMPYILFERESDRAYGMAESLAPFEPSLRAKTLKLVSDVTKGASFSLLEPHSSGIYILNAPGKKIWVWQNRPIYSWLAGNDFPLTGIPAKATTLRIYRSEDTVDKPYRTVALSSQSQLQLNDLPANETLMLVADAPEDNQFPGLKLDFTTNGHAAPGYLAVLGYPWRYCKALGFGYAAKVDVNTADRGAGEGVGRTIHWMHKDQTFLVDAPNGNYRVKIYIGDPKNATNNIDIYAQGVKKLDGISTTLGQVRAETFDVPVANGQIALDFKSRKGADGSQFWSVAGLEVTRL